MPVVPEGARYATLNINTIEGGQAGMDSQTPCVADRCKVIFDRRFLLEEGFEACVVGVAFTLAEETVPTCVRTDHEEGTGCADVRLTT